VPNIERVENLVLGSGGAGKFVAWTRAGAGRRTVLVERALIGGACPNVACRPSKNMIYSAKVISLARRGAEFGLKTESLSVDMERVQRRKRLMVEGLRQAHLDRTHASGAELIMGNARFCRSPHGRKSSSKAAARESVKFHFAHLESVMPRSRTPSGSARVSDPIPKHSSCERRESSHPAPIRCARVRRAFLRLPR
jgi:pyruvate/2-oxoglutarate dehydrogenase complex dihydrolipoamide dehydrogenase (E3) component